MTFNLKPYLNYHSPGYVIDIYQNGQVSEYCFGTLDSATNSQPCDHNTLYDLASLTKIYTATLVYIAYDEGKWHPGDPIQKFDPGYRNLSHITLLDLLSHNQEIWTDGYLGDAKDAADFQTILHSAYQKSNTPTYIDADYIILGQLLEKIYQKPYAKLLTEKILRPLGLKHTAVNPQGTNIATNEPHNSQATDVAANKPSIADQPSDRTIVQDRKARRARELGIITGHASIFATGADVLTFLRSFLDASLLKPSTIRFMLQHDNRNEYNQALINQATHESPISQATRDENQSTYGNPSVASQPLETFNFMGARYHNVIPELNEIPTTANDNTIAFSGYTGPIFAIDFDRQTIVTIMCNILCGQQPDRQARKQTTRQLLSEIWKTL